MAFYRMPLRLELGTFSGFMLGGYAEGKTDTGQYTVSIPTGTTAVVRFGGEPYFTTPTVVTGIAYDKINNIWVLSSASNTKTPISTDGGLTWTETTFPTNCYYVGFGSVVGTVPGFIGCGTGGGAGTNYIAYTLSSSPLSGWTTSVHPSMGYVGHVQFDSGTWVAIGNKAVGTNSDILYSTDGGGTFNDIAVSPPTFLSGGRFVIKGMWDNGGGAASAWVACGFDPSPIRYTYATDGDSGWASYGGSLAGKDLVCLATDGGSNWVAVTTTSKGIYYSNNYGSTWSLATLNAVSGGSTYNGTWVAYGSSGIWIMVGSSNGTTKTLYSTNNGVNWNAVSFTAPAEEFRGSPAALGGQMVLYVAP